MSLALAACDSTGGLDAGTMSLLLTDDEGDFTQAWVTIERIELVGDGQPVVLMDTPFTTNLLTLSNDVAALVEDVTVPGGSYSQVRFIIPDACIGVEGADASERIYASTGFDECGDADGALQLPSFAQTGIKVKLPGGSVEVDGNATILLLDFDVAQSFGHQAGGSGQWVMTPVIRAEEIAFTGSIVVELTVADGVDLGAVGATLADFQATLSTETEPQPFADPDEDGVFTATFFYVMPDETHDVGVELVEGVSFDFTLDPVPPQSVTLSSGEGATVAFEVTAASPSS